MPVTHLLDTSVYSQPLKPTPHPVAIQRWHLLGNAAVAVSAICEAEVLFGLEKKQSAKLTASYEKILKGNLQVIPVDGSVAASYAKLRAGCEKRGTPVADMDLLIAATAHAHNLTVATLNVSDFAAISDITVEDWSKYDEEYLQDEMVKRLRPRRSGPKRPNISGL